MNNRKVASRITTLVCSLLVAATGATAATQNWVPLAPQCCSFENTLRYAQSSAFNPASNTLVVFGGQIEQQLPQIFTDLNDLWVLTNANGLGGTPQWTNLILNGDPASPAPRYGAFTAYDQVNNRLIVFGGCSGFCLPVLNDVWVLANADGSTGEPTWMQIFPTGGPPAARTFGAAIYDPGSNSMIIFAGQDGSGFGGNTFSDVWVLSNANGLGGTPAWTQLSPVGGPPPGQYGLSGIYDQVHNIMVVFAGGAHGTGNDTNAVWALLNANGQGGTPTWLNLVAEGAKGSPPVRQNHTAVYDPTSNAMVVYGGAVFGAIGIGGTLDDVWILSNANGMGGTPTWRHRFPGIQTLTGQQPAGRSYHSAVYDSENNQMITFGGAGFEGLFYSTWVLTDANGM